MNQGFHEATIINEVLRGNASLVDHYNVYMNSCQDQQLHSLLDRQYKHIVDSFQRLTQIMQNHGMDTYNIPLPTTMSIFSGGQWPQQYSSGGMSYPNQQNMNKMSGQSMNEQSIGIQSMNSQSYGSAMNLFNDRVIAEGALQFHKSSAECATRAALESSEPHIRSALSNMARNCIDMSYEVYNYMAQRGWYQQPTPPNKYISHNSAQQQQYSQQ